MADNYSDDEQRERLLIYARQTARRVYWSKYDRDEHTCRRCGRDVRLEVHHRDSDPLNNHLNNLVALCHRCHRGEHRRRATVARLTDWKRKAPTNCINTTAVYDQHEGTQ